MTYSALFYYSIRKAKYMHTSEHRMFNVLDQNNKDGFGSSNDIFAIEWQAQDGL